MPDPKVFPCGKPGQPPCPPQNASQPKGDEGPIKPVVPKKE